MLLIIVILVAVIIPLQFCQDKTSIDKMLIDNYPLIMLVNIIIIPNRKTINASLEDQRKDQHERCRDVI